MDTSSEPNVFPQPSVPVIQTRKNLISSETERRDSNPILISPLNSPHEKSTENENPEAIQLVFCATNQHEATQLCKQNFSHHQFLFPNKNNPHHFNFSTAVHQSEVPKVIELINQLNIVHLRTMSNKKTYAPEQRHHCQDCQILHQK